MGSEVEAIAKTLESCCGQSELGSVENQADCSTSRLRSQDFHVKMVNSPDPEPEQAEC